jgi:glucose/arabinose dehydrogenase
MAVVGRGIRSVSRASPRSSEIASLTSCAVLVAALGAAGQESGPAARRERPELPGTAEYAQLCAGCHGPGLTGGSASSLVDRRWLYGGDNESILASIRDGRPDTAMIPFRDLLSDEQIEQLLFLIRFNEAFVQYRPPPPMDPAGALVESEKLRFRLEMVARDISTPWGIAFLPGGRLLISERPGRLSVVSPGSPQPVPVSGTPVPWTVQDGGFFDVELHPDHAENGWVYLAYAAPGAQNTSTTEREGGNTSMTRIVRGRIRGGAWVDEEALYEPPPELFGPENVHYGCRFAFDADGNLLYSIGDRGVKERAQNLGSPLGKVHRIRADGGIPADNPFVDTEGAVPTIWTYGHRNPQGFSFDPATGLLWEAEHGPVGGDELNVLEPGRNYGWAETSHGLEPGVGREPREGMEPAVVHWTPAIAPSAIHFYSGDRYPSWDGSLFVTGLGGTALRRLEVEGRRVLHEEVVFDSFGRVREVATGPDGFLYVTVETPGPRLSSPTDGFVVRLIPEE